MVCREIVTNKNKRKKRYQTFKDYRKETQMIRVRNNQDETIIWVG